MVIGTLPVVIAVSSNRRDAVRDGRLPLARLLPSLLLIGFGIAAVHRSELRQLRGQAQVDLAGYGSGALLALGALACWTWYPLRNADWLRHHPDRPSTTWATAQGLATLPLAALAYVAFWLWSLASKRPFEMPLGPTPGLYLALMFGIGLFASWLGTLCWNRASQRLPTTLAGQLIVFETLSALAYAFVLRGRWPDPETLGGIALLVAGVAWAVRVRPGAQDAAP
jgi:drug/metabolite transporter (DMT)-like permease